MADGQQTDSVDVYQAAQRRLDRKLSERRGILMYIAILRESRRVSRMQEVDGKQQERVLAVDEFGNESWVPADRLTGNGPLVQTPEKQPTALQQAAKVKKQVKVRQKQRQTTPDNTTTQGNDNSNDWAAAIDSHGQKVPGFFATNAGAGCTFFALWIAAGMLGGFCRVFGPNVMIAGYIVGVVLWWGGYLGVYLPWWYRSQPWTAVKSTVEVPVRDKKGREKVDRNGRVVTEEKERVVIQEHKVVDPASLKTISQLYVKAWRPFVYKWVKPGEVSLTEAEVRKQYEQN